MSLKRDGLGLIEYARKLANDAGVQVTDDEIVDMVKRSLARDDEAWEQARKSYEERVIGMAAQVLEEAKRRTG